jgi:hypothetical protein
MDGSWHLAGGAFHIMVGWAFHIMARSMVVGIWLDGILYYGRLSVIPPLCDHIFPWLFLARIGGM